MAKYKVTRTKDKATEKVQSPTWSFSLCTCFVLVTLSFALP